MQTVTNDSNSNHQLSEEDAVKVSAITMHSSTHKVIKEAANYWHVSVEDYLVLAAWREANQLAADLKGEGAPRDVIIVLILSLLTLCDGQKVSRNSS